VSVQARAKRSINIRYDLAWLSTEGRWLAFGKNADTLFSMPSEALSSIRSSLARWTPLDLSSTEVLPLGISALDAALPGGGVALGGVTELQVRGASGAATSFALAACRAAQQRGRQLEAGGSRSESSVWCAFIDPSASLFAPGVTRLGVDLAYLLVTRPETDAIDRVAVRIAEANLVAVLIIDLRGVVQPSAVPLNTARSPSQQGTRAARSLDEHSWQRTVRRLSLAIKSSSTSVLLITQAEQFQSLPLPTFQRLELTRSSQTSFELRVAKERTGRVSGPRVFPCSIFDQRGGMQNDEAQNDGAQNGWMRNGGNSSRNQDFAALTRKVS
jgi:recombination protein RecA